MHGGTHICAAVKGRESDKLSSAALTQQCWNPVQLLKRVQHSPTPREPLLYCTCALDVWVQCIVSKGHRDLRLFEVTVMTWGRQSPYKANINCATSSENNGGQDTECALIHISIVCPPLLLLLRARSISGVKEGGEARRRGSSSGGSGGLAVFFLLCLCANAQTVQ